MRFNSKLFIIFGVLFLLFNVTIATDDDDNDSSDEKSESVEENSCECSSEEKEKSPPKKKCTGQNEEWSKCVSPCGETCATLDQDLTCNFKACIPGCDCRKGFFRNSKKVCVPPEKCDCKENEEFNACWNPCPPQTCAAIGKAFKCAQACKPACKCQFNFRRNDKGICIPIQKCPPLKCTKPNEIFNSCPPSCYDGSCKGLEDRRVCPAVVRECFPSCVCKEGFRRNDKGECILTTKCPCKDPNAEVVECPNPCPGGTCKLPSFSLCKIFCQSYGCQCKDGFLKDADGKCIKFNKCPCDDPNAEFIRYPNPCPGGTCDRPQFQPCKAAGKPYGCQCKKGYVKNSNGKCIKLSECPNKCKENEEYSKCGTVCRQTCQKPNPICTEQCVAGCFCKKDYILDNENGKCILKKNCPKDDSCEESDSCSEEEKCGKNEQWDECNAGCRKTCANRNPKCNKKCVAGCICKKDYILNKDKGRCIPISKCPKDESCEESSEESCEE